MLIRVSDIDRDGSKRRRWAISKLHKKNRAWWLAWRLASGASPNSLQFQHCVRGAAASISLAPMLNQVIDEMTAEAGLGPGAPKVGGR